MLTPASVSLAILVATYALLFTDKFHRLHRTVLSIAGATAMVLAGKAMDFYPTFPDGVNPEAESGATTQITAIGAIDWNTLGLLFGMMVIVGIFEETGIFEYIAIRLAKVTRGSYWLLMISLGWFTFIASALLDNVTTVIFVSSITVSIASILKVNPIPLLISEAIMSGIGGMATLVGDPPNIIIGSAAGLSFLDFVIYLGPIALIIGITTNLTFRWLFRRDLTFAHEDQEGLQKLDEREALQHPSMLRKMGLVFALVLALFTIHHEIHLEPSVVAIAGAALALLWVPINLLDVLGRIKWDVLIFFAGLFVIVGGLEAAGILQLVAQWMGSVVLNYPVLSLLVVLWGSAFFSAIVDNIPFTIAFVPIIVNLEGLGVDVFPFWWVLAAGVAIGGCSTPIGASANVYVVSLSEHSGFPISFPRWVRIGLPAVIIQLIIASALIYGMFQAGII